MASAHLRGLRRLERDGGEGEGHGAERDRGGRGGPLVGIAFHTGRWDEVEEAAGAFLSEIGDAPHYQAASAYGAPAVSAPFVLMPCTDSLVAVRITGDRFSVAWRADGQAATPVIAGDTVLYVQPGGGRLRALRLSDGQPRASQDLNSGATSFPAVAVSGDLVVATAGRGFAVFGGA